jgi:nicotinate (nicotinamide) nucleotide adenylyltransferase
MEFFRRAPGRPDSLGVLAGTFNPPTRAHLALAEAALSLAGEVVFVLPRLFPHKAYDGAPFEDRVRMLELATAHQPRYSIASTETGLFIDVARACRAAYHPGVRLLFLCGSDAAERIVNWDYGRPGSFAEQLKEFELLVADRETPYSPPAELRHRIHSLKLHGDFSAVSATEVRGRIARNQPWRHLVPEAVAGLVERLYPPTP